MSEAPISFVGTYRDALMVSPHALRSLDPTDTLAEWLGAQDSYSERLSWDAGGIRAARDL
ncbi:hypothetical protein BO221_29915 [Archangium sp. Cb G35]|uniref:hypothetical protein n=1 Tax=Archangium sp. Cb G35 TaxID=1920190 RepID=UPI000937EBA1|nr:hypothetical protein [Archangium sp. Cb G35]OJT21087.1 hypothetical protein BO221_29915 [Archangium sp. Cb G35]